MIAEFIHYYPGYTVKTVLREYVITYYALLETMFRLKASDHLEDTQSRALSFHGGEGLSSYISGKKKQAGGLHAILKEVKNIKK